MTSSFILSQLERTTQKQNPVNPGAPWSYSMTGSPLGGIEDSHIKLQGNCHPDFFTVPIGRPDGVKMCVRKPLVGKNSVGCSPLSRIGDPLHAKAQFLKNQDQGYNRGSVRMYDTQANFPIQEWNPQYYADRRMPWEQDLLRRDYPRTMAELRYSGTGIETLRTPSELRDTGRPYYQYQYSFTPKEDWQTGMRTATRPDQSLPEIKYDVTRLHQPYPVWKDELEYLAEGKGRKNATRPDGRSINMDDTQFYSRIV